MNLKKIEKIKNINGKNMKLKEFLENLNMKFIMNHQLVIIKKRQVKDLLLALKNSKNGD
jgi:hypothetical protein